MALDRERRPQGLERLYADYERALGAQRLREEDLDYRRLEYHLPLLERLDAVEDSSVVLYDLYRRQYAFLTGSFKFLLGFQRGGDGSAVRVRPED